MYVKTLLSFWGGDTIPPPPENQRQASTQVPGPNSEQPQNDPKEAASSGTREEMPIDAREKRTREEVDTRNDAMDNDNNGDPVKKRVETRQTASVRRSEVQERKEADKDRSPKAGDLTGAPSDSEIAVALATGYQKMKELQEHLCALEKLASGTPHSLAQVDMLKHSHGPIEKNDREHT